jgi:hypothetical protein
MSYALIESFTGRCSQHTDKPVHVLLFRNFDPKTLRDVYKLELMSGRKHEVYENLTPDIAKAKFEANKRWWS